MFWNTCVVCGGRFRSERMSGKYDSEACKQVAKRQREKERLEPGRQFHRAETGLRFLAEHNPEQLGYFRALLADLMSEQDGFDRMYKCDTCGQHWFGGHPPEHCHFCSKQADFNGAKLSLWGVVNN